MLENSRIDDDQAFGQNEAKPSQDLERVDLQEVNIDDEDIGHELCQVGDVEASDD